MVRSLYERCGTAALRDGTLQRCFRDMHADSRHVLVGDRNPYEYTNLLLADGGQPSSSTPAGSARRIAERDLHAGRRPTVETDPRRGEGIACFVGGGCVLA